MFSFGYSTDMYRFTVRIGKEGRQALRQLEFAWSFNHPKKHTSKLGDCINLQRLHIGLNRIKMEGLSLRENPNIWKWRGHGEHTLKLLYQLPRGLELKIRQVGSHMGEISPFFEGDQPTGRPIYPDGPDFWYQGEEGTEFEFKEGVVEEFEAKLKESLKQSDMPVVQEVQGRRRNAAIVGEKKRQATTMK